MVVVVIQEDNSTAKNEEGGDEAIVQGCENSIKLDIKDPGLLRDDHRDVGTSGMKSLLALG